MGNDDGVFVEELIRERSLAFFGAVMASVSHELNNVISIIDQSSGLLEDYAMISEQGKTPPADKLRSIADRVGRQTKRGLGIISRLNKFAHSADHPKVECNLSDVVVNITTLSNRLADMKKVELETAVPEQPLITEIDPFSLQQLLFSTIRGMLDLSHGGERIVLSVEMDEDGAVVTVTGTGIEYKFEPGVVEIHLAQMIPAEVTASAGDGVSAVVLKLAGEEAGKTL